MKLGFDDGSEIMAREEHTVLIQFHSKERNRKLFQLGLSLPAISKMQGVSALLSVEYVRTYGQYDLENTITRLSLMYWFTISAAGSSL